MQPIDLETGPARVEAVVFSPDGKILAVTRPDASVVVLDPASARVLHRLQPVGNDGTTALAFARDGTLATGTAGGIVQLWSPQTGRQLAGPLPVSGSAVASISFDPSGARFATTGRQDGAVRLWFTRTLQQEGSELNTRVGATSAAAFTPNGARLVAVDDAGYGVIWPTSLAAWERHACAIARSQYDAGRVAPARPRPRLHERLLNERLALAPRTEHRSGRNRPTRHLYPLVCFATSSDVRCFRAMNTEVDRILAIGRRRWMRRHEEPTFLFVDLAGYTAMTETRGDTVAAETARRFRRTMRSLCRRYGAWQVKSMGDGVMIWAPEAAQAVALATDAVREVGTRADLLPVRVGVHTGAAVMDGMDWYGATVNVAARLADEAEPNQALVSATTLAAAMSRLSRPPKARREFVLRGVEQPIVAWRLT